MKLAINYLLRTLCLLAYVMAVAKLTGLLPAGSFDHAPLVAGLLLSAHVAELPFAFRHLRRYQGTLAMSIGLTLLFGLMHWKPLAEQPSHPPTRG